MANIKKQLPRKIYIPTRKDFNKCLDVIKKAGGFDNGMINWLLNRKKYGYSSGEAFTIISLLMTLVYDIGIISENLDKIDKNKKYGQTD